MKISVDVTSDPSSSDDKTGSGPSAPTSPTSLGASMGGHEDGDGSGGPLRNVRVTPCQFADEVPQIDTASNGDDQSPAPARRTSLPLALTGIFFEPPSEEPHPISMRHGFMSLPSSF